MGKTAEEGETEWLEKNLLDHKNVDKYSFVDLKACLQLGMRIRNVSQRLLKTR